ncbi:MAG TPA: SDR family NAD(P)-dependent oxidoreductase, partial [Chitinophagales bacterium]|nr:SDR family NAD(P)-dependent oxidoreductase [Chitinophagales bacterium]
MSTFLEKYGPWAIVTGASSGIGVEFSRQLASKGLNVVLVARRKHLLDTLSGELIGKYNVQTKVIEIDLSLDGFHSTLLDATNDLDVGLLVNNAGMGCEG